MHWWRCHAPEPQRRWRRRLRRALDEDVAGERCGVRPKGDDDEQRGRRFAVRLLWLFCCRWRRVREPEREAGSAAQSAWQAAHLQRAERPQERPLPPSAKLSVQRAGETTSLGLHLPCLCVSYCLIRMLHTCPCVFMCALNWLDTCWCAWSCVTQAFRHPKANSTRIDLTVDTITHFHTVTFKSNKKYITMTC